MGQDLREISKSFKVICEGLETEFEKQHPYEGNFHHSSLSWRSLSNAEQTWLFAVFRYMDAIVREKEALEEKVKILEERAIFI